MLKTLGVVLLAGAVTAGRAGQTGPADDAETTRYAVAYFDVQPAAVATLRATFARYRDASRSDSGFGAVELLQQNGNAGQFVIVETWRDQAAVDGHAKSSHTRSFRDGLLPIRVSGYDERPYKPFAIGAPRPAGADAIYVVTHVDVGPQGDATGLLRRLAEASRAEPGCLRFDILQHAARANHFTIIEEWRNPQARDVHAAAVHTRQYREELQPLIGSPLDERLMRLLP